MSLFNKILNSVGTNLKDVLLTRGIEVLKSDNLKEVVKMGLFNKILNSLSTNSAGAASSDGTTGLKAEWKQDRVIKISAPDNLEELKKAVDVTDPGSVAAYWLYAVTALTADYDTGMSMMKYLFADIEPFGSGFTEGGLSGRAGWDPYFNERLTDDDYRWLPRTYFDGACADNGFHPSEPLSVSLHFNAPNTETINEQTLKQLGRLNIVYYIKSNAAGNKVNLGISKFAGSDRWYVTQGISSSGFFYDQRAALTATAKQKLYN
ncbi:MAG: hypothetical protein J6U42_04565 [Lachnospiraceae bacterium]|nr:hypothetical protein [Lachnospiraceae bacterium]